MFFFVILQGQVVLQLHDDESIHDKILLRFVKISFVLKVIKLQCKLFHFSLVVIFL